MSDEDRVYLTPRLRRILMTEEAIYGLILVSGMIVVSGSTVGTSVDALITVTVTVIIFFAAHVYAGALSRMAETGGGAGVRASIGEAALEASGLLAASAVPIGILALGTSELLDDGTALWVALSANTVLLAALGWVSVARWSSHWSARLLGALITASFGGVLIILKGFVSH